VVEPSVRFEDVRIPLPTTVHGLEAVNGVLGIPEWWPTGSRVGIVLAQATQKEDPLLESIQRGLTERAYLTLRFRFPYSEAGKKRPDPMPVLHRTYQAAVSILGRDPTAAPAHIITGGKNLGALVAAHAATSRVRVEGLFFLGYPLHKQDKPEEVRADRLFRVISPMLFVQGTRDRHCDLPTLRKTLARVGAPVQLHSVEDADHSFRVAKKSGRTPEEVQTEIMDTLANWIRSVLGD
jgi:predicted alpha/beta-hydrolase family hydrolase